MLVLEAIRFRNLLLITYYFFKSRDTTQKLVLMSSTTMKTITTPPGGHGWPRRGTATNSNEQNSANQINKLLPNNSLTINRCISL